MVRPKVEWDPSWDDDWQSVQGALETEIEEQQPPDRERALDLYRYGFSVARRRPTHTWSDVESDLYQDYMSVPLEEREEEGEEPGWEHARAWAHRGWEAARP